MRGKNLLTAASNAPKTVQNKVAKVRSFISTSITSFSLAPEPRTFPTIIPTALPKASMPELKKFPKVFAILKAAIAARPRIE